ncbi:1-deoxy-D-xylulose-5-phosphate reductoisomerase [archaeon]|nr:1-deoxy-D-xylulose-5-phosphate reductoisomerase [archaeon]
MMKSISILGSTGSIGSQCLDVCKWNPGKLKVVGLAAFNEVEELARQINEFKPVKACLFNEEKAEELKEKLGGKTEIVSGLKGLEEIACLAEADTVVSSVVGSIGIQATIKAINAKKNLAIANKETLVAAGSIVMKEVKKNQVKLMPIDSEHSALFQCLNGEKLNEAKKLVLTCSGGTFRGRKRNELEKMKASDALKHPTWSMGSKITIDSATLMNKGLEVIEAHWLYGMPYEKIYAILHPQSIIHSMVEFIDGSVMAQLAVHDMRLPIQYSLTYPDRLETKLESLDLAKIGKLEFGTIDLEAFPCLCYAYEAGSRGGTMPAAMNAANEIAVSHFLKDEIGFFGIEKTVRHAMDIHKPAKNPSLDEILEADRNARKDAEKFIEGLKEEKAES